jgi:glutamyl-tRNA(Gln) amidotransferase subunit E
MGVAGIFHTDELPAYGITQEEVVKVNEFLGVSEEDAFIMVADESDKARNALEEVQHRAKIAMEGVPEETRKALEDATQNISAPYQLPVECTWKPTYQSK